MTSSLPTDTDIRYAWTQLLQTNLGLRGSESILILSDRSTAGIAQSLEAAARSLANRVEHLQIRELQFNGQEPREEVGRRMGQVDVVVAPLSRSISWTQARQKATQAGVRIATMPGITAELLCRNFPADYQTIRERVNRLCDRLDSGHEVNLRTRSGTSLTFSISRRLSHGRKGGLFLEKGHWGNLPCGEAFIAPVEGTADGIYFIDASLPGWGLVNDSVRVRVEKGLALEISGGDAADWLLDSLKAVGNLQAFNLAEFGIGCNDRACVTGVTLEDEKAIGTCHLALGSNVFFGGSTDAGIHLDGVIRNPDVYIDGQPILKDGRHLV